MDKPTKVTTIFPPNMHHMWAIANYIYFNSLKKKKKVLNKKTKKRKPLPRRRTIKRRIKRERIRREG